MSSGASAARETGEAMVKSRRHHLPASSVCCSSLCCCCSSSPSPATSLSLISNPPHLKPSTAACTPFISSLKRCPLVDVNAEFSGLEIAGKEKGEVNKAALQQEGGGEVAGGWAEVNNCGGRAAAAGYNMCCGRARLQQHRIQVSGKVIVPDTWGLEQHLQEWVSYGLVEDALKPVGLMSARSALVADSRAAQRQLLRPTAAAAASPSSPLHQPAAPPKLLIPTPDPLQVSSCG